MLYFVPGPSVCERHFLKFGWFITPIQNNRTYFKLKASVLSSDLNRNKKVPNGAFRNTASAAGLVISPANLNNPNLSLYVLFCDYSVSKYQGYFSRSKWGRNVGGDSLGLGRGGGIGTPQLIIRPRQSLCADILHFKHLYPLKSWIVKHLCQPKYLKNSNLEKGAFEEFHAKFTTLWTWIWKSMKDVIMLRSSCFIRMKFFSKANRG